MKVSFSTRKVNFSNSTFKNFTKQSNSNILQNQAQNMSQTQYVSQTQAPIYSPPVIYPQPPVKTNSAKNLINIIPDSFVDEILVGALVVGLTAITIKNAAKFKKLLNQLTGIDKKVSEMGTIVSQNTENIGKVSNIDIANLAQKTEIDDVAKKQIEPMQRNINDLTNKINGMSSTSTSIPMERVFVNNQVNIDFPTVMHGYGTRQKELESILRTEASKRIYGLTPKANISDDIVTIRIPTSEFHGVAKTGGMGNVPPELLANTSAFINSKQKIRYVLDMPMYLGEIERGKAITELRPMQNGKFKYINKLNDNVIAGDLERIATMDVPILSPNGKNIEKVEVFLQKGRKIATDFDLSLKQLSDSDKQAVQQAINANQPFDLNFGILHFSRKLNKEGNLEKPVSQVVHDAVFYKSDKFDFSGPQISLSRNKDIYSDATYNAGETERFMYFDKFFYEFWTNQKKLTTTEIGADMIVGNDWHTGGIAAMTRLLTKARESVGVYTQKEADKIYNTPIITLFHNAGLSGATWHSQGKLAGILFDEHSAMIAKNAWMPKGAEVQNGIFAGASFNPQTMAAVYSDTLVPVSTNYGKEIAENQGFGGVNTYIYKLRQDAMSLTNEIKKDRILQQFEGEENIFPKTLENYKEGITYVPITNGADRSRNLLPQDLGKKLQIQGEQFLYRPADGMSTFDWKMYNKEVAINNLKEYLNVAKNNSIDDFRFKDATKIFSPAETNLDGVDKNTMILASAGRFSDQKGLDIWAESIEEFYSKYKDKIDMNNPPVFFTQGQGDASFTQRLLDIKKVVREKHGDKAADRIFVASWFSEPGFYDRAQVMADGSVMSSWFEPCGLVHKEMMSKGVIPVINKTGGLTAGLKDKETAIFSEFKPEFEFRPKCAKEIKNFNSLAKDKQNSQIRKSALDENKKHFADAIHKFYELFQDKNKFAETVGNAYNSDFSWLAEGGPAKEYVKLYSNLGVIKPEVLN